MSDNPTTPNRHPHGRPVSGTNGCAPDADRSHSGGHETLADVIQDEWQTQQNGEDTPRRYKHYLRQMLRMAQQVRDARREAERQAGAGCSWRLYSRLTAALSRANTDD